MAKIKEVKVKNKKQGKTAFTLLKLSLLAFAIYMCILMAKQQIEINTKQIQLDSIKNQIQLQEHDNNELKGVIASSQKESEKYIEKIARESLGLSKPGERIFIGIAKEK